MRLLDSQRAHARDGHICEWLEGQDLRTKCLALFLINHAKKKLFEEINLQNTNSEMLIAESSFMYSNVLKDEYSVV